MITEKEYTIVEAVRAVKEANAARFDFDVAKIIESARLRQEISGHRIIRQVESGKREVLGLAPHTTGHTDA